MRQGISDDRCHAILWKMSALRISIDVEVGDIIVILPMKAFNAIGISFIEANEHLSQWATYALNYRRSPRLYHLHMIFRRFSSGSCLHTDLKCQSRRQSDAEYVNYFGFIVGRLYAGLFKRGHKVIYHHITPWYIINSPMTKIKRPQA